MLKSKMIFKKHFIFFTMAIAMLLVSSCSKDNDDTPDRDQFLGEYSVTDKGTTLTNNAPHTFPFEVDYDVTIIQSDSDISSIQISNFFNIEGYGAPSPTYITAKVEGNTFSIPSQNAYGITFEGRGDFSNGIITVYWTGYEASANGASQIYFCTATYLSK
jgi:hypothetical protein